MKIIVSSKALAYKIEAAILQQPGSFVIANEDENYYLRFYGKDGSIELPVTPTKDSRGEVLAQRFYPILWNNLKKVLKQLPEQPVVLTIEEGEDAEITLCQFIMKFTPFK